MSDVNIYLNNGRVIFVKDFDYEGFWNAVNTNININFIRVNDVILKAERIMAIAKYRR